MHAGDAGRASCLRPDGSTRERAQPHEPELPEDAHRAAQRQRPVQHLQRHRELRLSEPLRGQHGLLRADQQPRPRADWSTGNQPHHGFNGSINAAMPFGVFMTQTVTGNTGRYYTITTGKDDNQDGTKNDRPAGVGRNSALGPGFVNFNLNVSKAFFIGGAGARARGRTSTCSRTSRTCSTRSTTTTHRR